MQAEIITIGDEILIGQIVDSNSKWIAEELTKIGISVFQITSIQDNKQHILSFLKDAEERSDIVILTGGLGPTKDDITKLTLTEYFNDVLIFNSEIATHIEKMFTKINYPFTEVNKNQAFIPSKCIPLFNEFGTAPGMWFANNNKIMISLPGVPYEMKGLMRNQVIPKLIENFELPIIIHKTIITYGIGESVLAAKIENWENELPQHVKLAYLPSFGSVRLRLSTKGYNLELLQNSINIAIEKIQWILGDAIVGYENDETLEAIIGNLLIEKNQNLSLAESCTGGNIAKLITSVPGSSRYFEGSIVAYHQNIKINELKVDAALIKKYSIVSKQVAEAMALGIQQKFKTDYSIATTGNAGPTVNNTTASLGTVIIAIASPNGVISEEYFFGKPREKVIERSSIKALELLRKEILKN
ncbi:competence/damage-inducible protein A [Lutibacter sp.]|uniref:competence/damage-inducible protein A n=1 Tax=Lutibacter sp. TaxID=1925666 RepID=UPI002733594E|nr:competence/damage-inducible protein A [Lutibacter sp.]MDP3312370.1 competence/damage-inducible protein A [Lutibacter sp.]